MLGAMAWHQDTKRAAPLLAAWALSAMAVGTSLCLANHRDVCGTIGFRKPWGRAGVGVTVGASILPQLPTAMSLQYFPTCMRRRRFCCTLKWWLCGKYDKQYKICQCAASLKFVCVDLEIGDNCRAHFSHPSIGSLFFPHCNTYLLKECNRNQKLLPSHGLMASTSRTSPWVGLVRRTVCLVWRSPSRRRSPFYTPPPFCLRDALGYSHSCCLPTKNLCFHLEQTRKPLLQCFHAEVALFQISLSCSV